MATTTDTIPTPGMHVAMYRDVYSADFIDHLNTNVGSSTVTRAEEGKEGGKILRMGHVPVIAVSPNVPWLRGFARGWTPHAGMRMSVEMGNSRMQPTSKTTYTIETPKYKVHGSSFDIRTATI